MHSQNITFDNSSGNRLAAFLDVPVNGKVRAYALFAHCFTCTKNLVAVKHISRALTREGIAVLRFDFTGLGQSEGIFADTNFSSNVSDLVDAAGFLASHYDSPALLIGHSLGGPAVIAASQQLTACRAVVTIGSPCEPAHVTHLFDDVREIIQQQGQAQATIGGKKLTIKKQLIQDLETTSIEKMIGKLNKALLICHSPIDKIVDIEQAARIYAAARHPKSFISLDQADHLLLNKKDSLYAGSIIASWASRYINLPLEPEPTLAGKEQYVVVRTRGDELLTEINANGHSIVADEPESVGGTNQGPTPYELLASSLGACTAMTLQMYAKYKKLSLEDVTVVLKHDKVHADDGASCENRRNKIDVIEREIEIKGDLSSEQKQRMIEIADRCPVHQTLEGAVKVITRLKLE